MEIHAFTHQKAGVSAPHGTEKCKNMGLKFHFELTGLKDEEEENSEDKHFNILKRRLKKGQYFRTPCLGCSEFPVKRLELVDTFDKTVSAVRFKRWGMWIWAI